MDATSRTLLKTSGLAALSRRRVGVLNCGYGELLARR